MGPSNFLLLLILSSAELHTGWAEWCYTDPECGPSTWVTIGYCNGTHQSPINISDNAAVLNSSLTAFTFQGYDNASKLISLNNLGHTVQVNLDTGVTIAGGGLSAVYSASQFHFHWGNGSTMPGSEHRVNGKQFPMEMHIVHTKGGMSLAAAKLDPTGIAVLGVFIDVLPAASAGKLSTLSNLLSQVNSNGSTLLLNGSLSINSILQDLNLTSYYRYMGSLTTPTCDQAVVWTVFKNPILVDPSVVNAFATQLYVNPSLGHPIVNVFRLPQPVGDRQIQTSPAALTVPSTGPAHPIHAYLPFALPLLAFLRGAV